MIAQWCILYTNLPAELAFDRPGVSWPALPSQPCNEKEVRLDLFFHRCRLLVPLVLVMLLGAMFPVRSPVPALEAASAFRAYLVRPAEANLVIVADAAMGEQIERSRISQKEQLAAVLSRLATDGLAGEYTFNESTWAFHAQLSDDGRISLAQNPLVASVEPAPVMSSSSLSAASSPVGIQSVSSIIFVQVNSPFVWGRTNIGGLSVQLTLEDSTGTVKGIPTQGTSPTSIDIDPTQLYFETIFVSATTGSPVKILPGDRVRVVTSGDDPATPGLDPVEDKRVTVDDIRAWTSYGNESINGIAPANSSVVVTHHTSFPSLSLYLTPGASMTYAEVTAASDGSFSVSSFRTSADATHKEVGLKQGDAGFVRVRHPDGNEVYTVHGQNVLVLKDSSIVHGYAFGIPSVPVSPPIAAGVKVNRPSTAVTVTLKNSGGGVKATDTPSGSFAPYAAYLDQATIASGDTVEVSLLYNQTQAVQIPVGNLTAIMDLAANQVTGTGPANTQLDLGAGRVSGYLVKTSLADFLRTQVATDSNGNYTSGHFQCGTSNYLTLQPGSFGYAGYEDNRGNFIYLSFAAPVNDVMVNFPFIEGWIADGTVRPAVTIRSSGGSIKQQTSAAPLPLYLTNEKLYINTYYQLQTSQFIVPGDSLSITSGSTTYTIPVDNLTAFINTDDDTVNGEAPAGSSLRVIPYNDRPARRELVADASGTYTAGNPFTYTNTSSCAESSKVEDLDLGDSGRTYLRHADSNRVFAAYGRSINVQENENTVEVYPFVLGGLDWGGLAPTRAISVTLTPKAGSPVTASGLSSTFNSGKVKLSLTSVVSGTTQTLPVLIRVGDTISVSFDEGPTGLTRPVTISMGPLALITGSPDVDTYTLAGVGPKGWTGLAVLNSDSTAKPAAISTSTTTAYAPVQFFNAQSKLVTLSRGYNGLVSFTDKTGRRAFVAWAATTYPVKITTWLRAGDTLVCGTAAPNTTIRIHDVTIEGTDNIIGTGAADSQGRYCVGVSALYKNEVILAEADGTYSQPVVIGDRVEVFMPFVAKYGGVDTYSAGVR